jgi:hypothetical protein
MPALITETPPARKSKVGDDTPFGRPGETQHAVSSIAGRPARWRSNFP